MEASASASASASAPARARRGVWVVAAVGVLIAGAGAWWYLSQDTTGSLCQAAAVIDPPTAPDPEAAFVAWFEQSDPAAPIDDFERSGDAQWRRRTSEDEWVQVDLAERSDGQWAVTGANRCWEYHGG